MPAIAYRNLSQTEFDYLLKSQSNANYLLEGSIRDIGIFKSNARLRGGSIFSILASVGRRKFYHFCLDMLHQSPNQLEKILSTM